MTVDYEVTNGLKMAAVKDDSKSGGVFSTLAGLSLLFAVVGAGYKFFVQHAGGKSFDFVLREIVEEGAKYSIVPKILIFLASCYIAFKVIFSLAPKTSYDEPASKLYPKTSSQDYYDVAIVGAGPSGSTCAFYLARDHKAKVLLLEKKKFPRDKYCGDAVPNLAHKHLKEMGVLEGILNDKKGHPADNGGMVSPSGLSFIGKSVPQIGHHAVIGIRRIVMDERVAMATKKAGAILTENTEVTSAKFDKSTGLWTIEAKPWTGGADKEWAVDNMTDKNESTEVITYKARALVCADGATSTLARYLGIVTTAPDAVCSRAYVQGDSHNFKADGVVFYPPKLLPGYCSVFRVGAEQHDLSFCCYIIPGNPNVKNDDLTTLHHDIIKNDPYVSRALGPTAKLERMKAASLRLGGIPKSYGSHLIIIGDAAGHIDPLTGEGIHLAMEGGWAASQVLAEAIRTGDYSERQMAKYQQLWMKMFGADFSWSMKGAQLVYKYPLLLDAACAMVAKRGPAYLAEWAEVMTGSKPKTFFLRPSVGLPLALEILNQVVQQKVFGKYPRHHVELNKPTAK
mmetsp:Transcript_15422/g.25486  ORF Transcript_15422/g.25486 Transcript_15422/m.25486 type:complete len:567 (+) Transcript_15422:113-1813(+)|eukprot:CAMPEP_0184656040 /NCGR_PEP_ID=MMETSP0308-20130426/15407_1 /TAXON_ID=38269 /ORGANISM="Gloeochaete witrockiana, Strain SAG 46.84" /LENGTH=566 /DNA_ID=CAMNT_0027092943 /DNA_START=78 /DNA_END=1778 /DNA_ORIENTATION=+